MNQNVARLCLSEINVPELLSCVTVIWIQWYFKIIQLSLSSWCSANEPNAHHSNPGLSNEMVMWLDLCFFL